MRESVRERIELYFFIFSLFSLRYTEIGPSEFVGLRTKSAILDEGYEWKPKTRDFAEFSIKNSENLMFRFFSDLRLSDGQIWSDQETKLIQASRATHGYQNIGVSSNYTRYGFSPEYVNEYVYE